MVLTVTRSVLAVALVAAAPVTAAAGPGGKGRPTKIAVPRMQVGGDDASLGRVLQEILTTEASRLAGVKVIGATDIEAMLGFEKQKDLLGCADDVACIAEVGGALGVDALLVSDLGRIGESYVVNLKLIDTRSIEVLSRMYRVVPAAGQLVDAVKATVPELLAAVTGQPVATAAASAGAGAPGAGAADESTAAGAADADAVDTGDAGSAAADARGADGRAAASAPATVETPADERAGEDEPVVPGAGAAAKGGPGEAGGHAERVAASRSAAGAGVTAAARSGTARPEGGASARGGLADAASAAPADSDAGAPEAADGTKVAAASPAELDLTAAPEPAPSRTLGWVLLGSSVVVAAGAFAFDAFAPSSNNGRRDPADFAPLGGYALATGGLVWALIELL